MARSARAGGRRDVAEIGLSFLDVISCGFGAVILLLMITRIADPAPERDDLKRLEPTARTMQIELFDLRRQSGSELSLLQQRQRELAALEQRLAELMATRDAVKRRLAELQAEQDRVDATRANLVEARQSLDAQMQRLAERADPVETPAIGGIPVDSEYVVFVIDTSGSMKARSWEMLKRQVQEVLDVYPRIKGFQVLSDGGAYMFPGTESAWIRDSPGRRQSMLQALETWSAPSPSSPVRGILRAVDTFWSADKRISVYVMGDDFQGGEIDPVVRTVARINPRQPDGSRRVRIHGIGFPGQLTPGGEQRNPGVARFAALMRELAHRNDGSFVALTR